MKKLLIQLQLSNYYENKFDMPCDSGFNMMLGRCREMFKHNPSLKIDVLIPTFDKLKQSSQEIVKQYLDEFDRLKFIQIPITPNAIITRYEFEYEAIKNVLCLEKPEKYTHVLINDPMLFRNYKALFNTSFKHNPMFITFSHFIDNPECSKFPEAVSMWHGQVEAAIRSDYNFWQCETAFRTFLGSMAKQYRWELVDKVEAKSSPWDDGYSSAEVNQQINESELRFNLNQYKDKTIVFVPNRVGDGIRSSDYTNCGKFLFDWVNKLYERRQDFIVIAGNPNQKISNDELAERCAPYVKLVDDTFTRNEFRYVARASHINVGLYNEDTYGGTAWRECIDLGCLPLSPNINEYKRFFTKTNYPFAVKSDFSDICEKLSHLIDYVKSENYHDYGLRSSVLRQSSYEETTFKMMQKIGLV